MLVTRARVRAEIIRQLRALGYRRRHRDGLLYPPPAPIAASQRITLDPLTVTVPGGAGPGGASPLTVVPGILTFISPAYSPQPSLAPAPESPTGAQEASLTAQTTPTAPNTTPPPPLCPPHIG